MNFKENRQSSREYFEHMLFLLDIPFVKKKKIKWKEITKIYIIYCLYLNLLKHLEKNAVFARRRNSCWGWWCKLPPKKIHNHKALALALTDEIHYAVLFREKYLTSKIEVLNILHDYFSFFRRLLCKIKVSNIISSVSFIIVRISSEQFCIFCRKCERGLF